VPGGFGRRPSVEMLARLRAALEQGVGDAQATLDFVLTLPPQDAGRSETAYAAAWPATGYGYEAADQIAVEHKGRRVLVPASGYRTVLAERTVEHSHARHSRWKGAPLTVGSLARIAVNGDRLPASGAAAAARLGLVPPFEDPLANNAAQVVELVADVERALELVDQLLRRPAEPEAAAPVLPRAGTGTAALEAPRGLLIHSYRYGDDGRLQQADIITPTAINAASIEHRLKAAVEQSPARDEATLTHTIEMVVRAYDPCLSCSVH
jgi:sulfhydrogenase subunit alpha